LIEKASQILDLAIAEKQFSAAVAALQEIGTLSGLRIERREVGRSGEFELLRAVFGINNCRRHKPSHPMR
jgi:hypothetical protein